MGREELHWLIDTMPEGALEHAKTVLNRLQAWPPEPPPEIEQIRRQVRERMSQRARPGTGIAGGGGGGSYTLGQGGRIRKGNYSSGYQENGFAAHETHHFHEGVEITITERMRLGEDGKTLIYSNAIEGPDGKRYTRQGPATPRSTTQADIVNHRFYSGDYLQIAKTILQRLFAVAILCVGAASMTSAQPPAVNIFQLATQPLCGFLSAFPQPISTFNINAPEIWISADIVGITAGSYATISWIDPDGILIELRPRAD
jgi:hypothetical protein